jgi:hypothetical protein
MQNTQVLTWLLSYDKATPPEALAINAASAAVATSEVSVHITLYIILSV